MSIINDLRYEAKLQLGKHPRVFYPWLNFRRRHRRGTHALTPRCVTDQTQLVIEGYPRSGNTFSVAATLLANPDQPPMIAHHIHMPAQFILGAKKKLPMILLLREPIGAASSWLIRSPTLTPRQALRTYIEFHSPLLAYVDRVVVADFDLVTGDYQRVMEVLNERFETSLQPFKHTAENVVACFAMINDRNLTASTTGAINESAVARPSALRAKAADGVKESLNDARYRDLLSRARELYAQFSQHACSRRIVQGVPLAS